MDSFWGVVFAKTKCVLCLITSKRQSAAWKRRKEATQTREFVKVFFARSEFGLLFLF